MFTLMSSKIRMWEHAPPMRRPPDRDLGDERWFNLHDNSVQRTVKQVYVMTLAGPQLRGIGPPFQPHSDDVSINEAQNVGSRAYSFAVSADFSQDGGCDICRLF